MLVAMSALTGPGLGRLLPMPLLIPNAWPIAVSASFTFGVIAMLADWRANGRVHPAYWWGMGINVGAFLASMALAYSPLGYAITEAVIAGTPGAERPLAPFLHDYTRDIIGMLPFVCRLAPADWPVVTRFRADPPTACASR
jgi:hypothetical protein